MTDGQTDRITTPKTARRSYASAVKIRKKIPLALNVHEMAIRLRRNSNVMLETRHSVHAELVSVAVIVVAINYDSATSSCVAK